MDATAAQMNYLEILFGDLGFDRAARNAFMSQELGRHIRFLDELTVGEARRMITELKKRKKEAS
jgi:hypothetical protein